MINNLKEKIVDGPKILIYDIETAPNKAAVWSLWKQNIGLEMIDTDWFLMSFSAKWLHEKEVFYEDQSHLKPSKYENDKGLLLKIWKLLDEADIVVAHNGKKFDCRKLNSRFVSQGLPPPSSYKIIDTLDIVKKNFNFASNSLAYLSSRLCKKFKKSKHGKFVGYELWKECLLGNLMAWSEMKKYNKLDVLALEELYLVLRPYDPQHPNVGVYIESEGSVCAVCGSAHVKKNGYRYTNVGKFQRYRCMSCNGQSRDRVSVLPKEVKRNLLTNNA